METKFEVEITSIKVIYCVSNMFPCLVLWKVERFSLWFNKGPFTGYYLTGKNMNIVQGCAVIWKAGPMAQNPILSIYIETHLSWPHYVLCLAEGSTRWVVSLCCVYIRCTQGKIWCALSVSDLLSNYSGNRSLPGMWDQGGSWCSTISKPSQPSEKSRSLQPKDVHSKHCSDPQY